MKTLLRILFTVFFSLTANACIWDAQSLWREKLRSHDLAKTILGTSQYPENTNQLRSIVKDLEAHRRENDPDWWNNLAGTYLRLSQPQTAVNLLEPVVAKFPDNYGIHANLGTAYHLLGRYRDAENEIARDLEINPNAHFGLEKYHLALLQYLVRDPKYQARHVYVDEFTAALLQSHERLIPLDSAEVMSKALAAEYTNDVAAAEADYESLLKTNHSDYETMEILGTLSAVDPPPPYRKKWNLARDINFEAGVIYMAQMNPKEPACITMLGIAAWKNRDYHLAAAAFERAIALGSPQSELLKNRVAGLNHYISNSSHNDTIFDLMLIAMLAAVLYYVYSKFRDGRRTRLAARA